MGGVFVSLHRMLMGGLVVSLCMVLGRCMVGFGCVLVMFAAFLMCVVCHVKISRMTRDFGNSPPTPS
jgi:hypothetical protein